MGIAELSEVCASCGDFVDRLNPVTGFCFQCSPDVVGNYIPCETCGNDFIPHQNSRRVCITCRRREWLSKNADSVERVMVHHQVIASDAIIRVANDNRPRCAMCGDKIKGGTRGRTKFCGKKDQCRRAAIRYHNYRKRNNLPDDIALEQAIHGKPIIKTST